MGHGHGECQSHTDSRIGHQYIGHGIRVLLVQQQQRGNGECHGGGRGRPEAPLPNNNWTERTHHGERDTLLEYSRTVLLVVPYSIHHSRGWYVCRASKTLKPTDRHANQPHPGNNQSRRLLPCQVLFVTHKALASQKTPPITLMVSYQASTRNDCHGHNPTEQ